MSEPRPLSDPFLRRSFISTALGGLVATGLLVVVAVLGPTVTTAWISVVVVALAYGSALFVTLTSYRIGWYSRMLRETERVGGHWMAYPVDEDGIPTSAPVTGRLVLDDPVERP